MGLSRSERNEDRRDARLARREALEVKAAAAAKKVSKTASSTQQSNTNAAKTSVQKASVDKVDISQAARNLAATVPKQAQISNNTGVMHGPPIPPKTSSTKTSNNTGAMHGPPIPPKTNSTQQSNTNAAKTSVQKTSVDRVDISEAARNLAGMLPKQAQTSNNTGVMHGPPIPNKNGKTWGEAGSEAAISTTAGTVVTTSVETGGQALLGNSSLPGPISKIIGVGVSTADVYYDGSAKLSNGSTNFGSTKTLRQSFIEASSGAILTELVSTRLLAAATASSAFSQYAPQHSKSQVFVLGLTTSYLVATTDSKIGLSSTLGEKAEKEIERVKQTLGEKAEKEIERVKQSGNKINEYIERGNKKRYSDFSDKEKQAIDKAMKNVADQNDKILKAKEKWEDANRRGDEAERKKAEKDARDARKNGGNISKETSIDRVKELNDQIRKEKARYNAAGNIRDEKDRKRIQDEAREKANNLRTQGGTLR
ncbi:hypothetical protein FB479_101616 [Brevibacillus sp. AG162]|uniref:hypothetical protein n=1 Tax=Brevibacillus sp. AG162 TaxID=2572910 RepID=UPI001150E995|nr:hypothetical protein [Brevibacillus sp. AG162]TQK75004.1 hypothetical protein FB479_101616 [Brevibacillus sp. AG162]